MTAGVETETHEGVAGLQQRKKDGLVRLRAGMRLNIGEIAMEKRLCAFDCQLFGDVHELASAIVPAARIAFCIFVGENRALGFQHGSGDDVLRRDQLDFVLLAAALVVDGARDVGIGFRQGRGEELVAPRLGPAGNDRHIVPLVRFNLGPPPARKDPH